MTASAIVWFRRDLRVSDQAALLAAAAAGPIIPVYILDDETPKHRAMGAASRWWLHHSLEDLDASLGELGSRLILRRGKCDEQLALIAEETGATTVHCLRHYEPWWRNAERAVAKRIDLQCHDGNYLAPPGTLMTGGGTPYKIYTPFWRALKERMPPRSPSNRPHAISGPDAWPVSDKLSDWQLLPAHPNWATGFATEWKPGEAGARERVAEFMDRAADYDQRRNLPSDEGSSRLSPHLHFGEVSPATIWHRTADAGGSVDVFLSEIGWRDYAQSIITQFSEYGGQSARAAFDHLPWRDGAQADADLRAWQRGRTGYPIVDAGMRQLWATGWMHNRVRMIAASFLIKHLLIDWRRGEQWFWDTLVDADYASNAVNWQWVAGSGVDSNMFPRIMAPLTQSEKFDAAGYIRLWVPELADVIEPAIHDPDAFGQRPLSYPPRIIGHREARERALAAYDVMKASGN